MGQLPEYKTILYASDLGEHTRPVFRHALSLAKQYSAQIVMLHVVEPIGPTSRAVIDTYVSKEVAERIQREGLHELLERMRKRLDKAYEEELGQTAGESDIVSEVVVVSGPIADTIVSQAKARDADLIVMGRRSHSVFGELLGSSARQVMHSTRIPVLVVPNTLKP